MRVNPYLNFAGNCREAFATYQKIFGGELTLITHEDMPMEGLSDDWKDKILHAHLEVDGHVIMGSDRPPEYYAPPTSMYVSLQFDEADEADRVYNALSEGGSIEMPIGETPWAYRFGMFTDRFGIPWIVNCNKPM